MQNWSKKQKSFENDKVELVKVIHSACTMSGVGV